MKLRHDQLPQIPEPPATVDLLQKLCDALRAEIERLRDQVRRAEDQFHRMQAEQLEAHAEHRRRWVGVQKMIADALAEALVVAKERDVTLTALRRLCASIEQCTRLGGVPEATAVVQKTYREAMELLALADGQKQSHHPDSEG